MQPAVLFDYASLEPATRDDVRHLTNEIRRLGQRLVGDVIEIGERLAKVKARLGHGQFLSWLETEFAWSERTARKWMCAAEAFKSASCADLEITLSAVYALSASSVPQSARDEAIARAQAGEGISHVTAQTIIAEHRPQPVKVAPDEPSFLFDEGEEEDQQEEDDPGTDAETSLFDEAPDDFDEDDDPPLARVIREAGPLTPSHRDAVVSDSNPIEAIARKLIEAEVAASPSAPLGPEPNGRVRPDRTLSLIEWKRFNQACAHLRKVFIRKCGGIAPATRDLTDSEKQELLSRLEKHQANLTSWIEHLRRQA